MKPADGQSTRAARESLPKLPLLLAALSGLPGLVYEVVWTREAALLASSQVESISAVLAAYFGGLALGARLLGPLADRTARPLALYGWLEIGVALLAAGAGLVAWSAREGGLGIASEPGALALAAALIAPASFLMGGTLPALVRSATRDAAAAARAAGWVVGANTAGGVLGVVLSILAVPRIGLRATLLAAVAASLAVGVAALACSGRATRRPRPQRRRPAPGALLVAAALAGVVTLAYEVLAARASALQLGSSLLAWGSVLALFLAALALGNMSLARRAAHSPNPHRDLGLVLAAAAIGVAGGCRLLVPSPAEPAAAPTPATLLLCAASIAPPALLMGGAFPFLVRLAARDAHSLGAAFGSLGAANTAGGIAGALLAPFLLLELLGLAPAILACAALELALGCVFLGLGAARGPGRALHPALALGLGALVAWPAVVRPPPGGAQRVLFVHDGPQASAVVLSRGGSRTLYVDGEPEASTDGSARRIEELLAALPLSLHPDPRSLLEVGLGSGITLARAARSALERIDCVEIASSVLRAAPYFAPDNGPVADGSDPRLRIVRGDGRSFLARSPGRYDVVLSNTVQPWSVGATGLYSAEYYARVAGALLPGGLAAQWLPVQRIGAAHLAVILRTFFAVFPEGGLWWGDENLIAIGSAVPVAPGSAERWRRLAGAAAVRQALGPGPLLSDDRPLLETPRWRPEAGGELGLLLRIARAESGASPPPIVAWIESQMARRAGESARADRLESRAEAAGLELARRSRLDRRVRSALQARGARVPGSDGALRALLDEAPGHRPLRFALARIAVEAQDLDEARRELEALLEAHPGDAEAWNLLGIVENRSGRRAAARWAFARALDADPFLHQALANAGLLARDSGELGLARELLARLRKASPLGVTPEEGALDRALRDAPGG